MQVLLELVKQVHDSQKKLDEKLSTHMTDQTEELAAAITKLMKDAFPGGDPVKHALYHESLIEQAKEKAEFWKEMRIHAGKWAGLGILSFIVGAVIVAVKARLSA
jgi:hypothetical protein